MSDNTSLLINTLKDSYVCNKVLNELPKTLMCLCVCAQTLVHCVRKLPS